MADEHRPIARVRLARARVPVGLIPIILVLGGVALAVGGAVAPLGPVARIALLSGAVVAALGAVALAVWVRSVRLDIEEDAVHLRSWGGDRMYALTPGPVTRVRLRGADGSSLRARSRWLGWELGRARLRDEEDVEVVRLRRTDTAILVPTQRGRLAIAAADEAELIAALSEAAHARQRTEAARAAEPAPPDEAEPERPAAPDLHAGDVRAVPADPDAYGSVAHVLTGIERAELEDRLARERTDAAHDAAERAATEAVATGVPLEPPVARPAAIEEAEDVASPRRRGWTLGRPRPSAAFVLVPLVGTIIVWGVGILLDRLPDATTDAGRLTALALVLAGPATSVGAIMARAWWPRIVGVVVTSGLVASVFVGRAILG
jgi:hypothetical protein